MTRTATAHAWTPTTNRGETRFLRLTEVIRRTGLGKTKIYELQKAGTFPSSVHVTSTAVRWVEGEVEDWLLAQVRTRTTNDGNDPASPTGPPSARRSQAAWAGMMLTGGSKQGRSR